MGEVAAEQTLLALAADDPRDTAPLSSRELELLAAVDRIEEQRLERAYLEQAYVEPGDEPDMTDQIERAKRDLLDARATYAVGQRALLTMMITDPGVRAVYSDPSASPAATGASTTAATTTAAAAPAAAPTTSVAPAEPPSPLFLPPASTRLRPLLARRDVLALACQQLENAHTAHTRALADAETAAYTAVSATQHLARALLDITDAERATENAWRKALGVDDNDDNNNNNNNNNNNEYGLVVQGQRQGRDGHGGKEEEHGQLRRELAEAERELEAARARWVRVRSTVRAAVVASGIDWAEDDELEALVLEEDE